MDTTLQREMIVDLPEGFTARGAQWKDIEPAFAMYNRWSRAVIGRDEISTPEIMRTEWKSPDFDPARDIRVVFAPNGRMAGYIEVWKPVLLDETHERQESPLIFPKYVSEDYKIRCLQAECQKHPPPRS